MNCNARIHMGAYYGLTHSSFFLPGKGKLHGNYVGDLKNISGGKDIHPLPQGCLIGDCPYSAAG
jgi:hypothetical protein